MFNLTDKIQGYSKPMIKIFCIVDKQLTNRLSLS